MIDFISWALAVEALGLIALPVTFVLFSRLPYGGYAFSKALGILLFSFLVWMVGFTGIIPLNRYWVSGLAIVLAAASFLVVCRRLDEFRQYLREQRWTIVIVDVLFLAAFAGWAAARAYDPAISHTEQPMDFALLNSVIRAESMPPQDPWLSGHSVSYYYFRVRDARGVGEGHGRRGGGGVQPCDCPAVLVVGGRCVWTGVGDGGHTSTEQRGWARDIRLPSGCWQHCWWWG